MSYVGDETQKESGECVTWEIEHRKRTGECVTWEMEHRKGVENVLRGR